MGTKGLEEVITAIFFEHKQFIKRGNYDGSNENGVKKTSFHGNVIGQINSNERDTLYVCFHDFYSSPTTRMAINTVISMCHKGRKVVEVNANHWNEDLETEPNDQFGLYTIGYTYPPSQLTEGIDGGIESLSKYIHTNLHLNGMEINAYRDCCDITPKYKGEKQQAEAEALIYEAVSGFTHANDIKRGLNLLIQLGFDLDYTRLHGKAVGICGKILFGEVA